jgi:serine/threonine protein kinase
LAQRPDVPDDRTRFGAKNGVQPPVARDPWGRAQSRLQDAVGARYRLVRELGQGGFGVVWEAYDSVHDRLCCIKVLRPELARDFSLVRFKREFRTARRLSHPCCVQVHELGNGDNVWFFSMELVAGTSLRHRTELHGDARAIAAIGLQVLAALDAVHSKAIVHRDIKPLNILIEPATDPHTAPLAKLTDFGIAKVGDLDDNEHLRALRGSPPYIAPEVIGHGVVDARCDLYSLGVSLYQALLGRHPLGTPADGVDWPAHILSSGQPAPLAAVDPTVPPAVAEVIMNLCAKDPSVRYRSAAQAYERLAGWLGSQADYRIPSLPPLTGSPYLAAPRLVGRDRECARIDEFLRGNLSAADGSKTSPPLLLLSGPAGVGKSRLLLWMLRAAEQHAATTLTGQCRSEIGAPFECMQPILARLRAPSAVAEPAAVNLNTDDTADIQDTATSAGHGPPADSTAGTEPLLEQYRARWSAVRTDENPPEAPAPSASAQTAAGSAWSSTGGLRLPDIQELRPLLTSLTNQLLGAVEARPTLIVIEDLQWCDFETLELLKLWTRSIAVDRADGRPLPIALVVTHRPVAGSDPLHVMARELASEGQAMTVELDVLSPGANVELAAELLMCSPDQALTAACQRLWGDQPSTPLYISQVLRLLLTRGLLTGPAQPWDGKWDFSRIPADVRQLIPGTVEGAIGERASRLSIETKAVLAMAAVFGRWFALESISEATGLDSALARECLEEAERAGFVSEPAREVADGSFIFTHDRFREALYRGLAPEQQQRLHEVVAATLLSQSAGKGRDVAADLALHFDRAGDSPQAYRFAVLAGEQAFRARQYSRASDLYAQAVKHADLLGNRVGHRLLCRLGDSAALVLHTERAEAAYQRALKRTRNRDRRLELLTRLGELHDRAHRSQTAVQYYARALDAGLPWYLRGAIGAWLLIVVHTLVKLVTRPAASLPFARFVFAQIPERRREALHHCALAASIRSAVHGQVGAWLRFGITFILTGLADRRPRPGASFGVAVGAEQCFNGFFGRDRECRAWAALDSLWCEDRMTTDHHRFGAHMARGAAALFLAGEADAIRELRHALQVAERRRDPRLMESAGYTLLNAYRLFARLDDALVVMHNLRRFADAENIASLQSTVLYFELADHVDRGNYAAALQVIATLRARTDSIDAKDRLRIHLTSYYELLARCQLEGVNEAIARDVFALLRVCEREPPTVPVVTLAGTVFALAVETCARLKRSGALPGDLARGLARARYRPRLVDVRGRWRRGVWLVGYSMYDAMQGRDRRARALLEGGLAHLTRFDNLYAHRLCRAGQRGFAPDSDLARRCTEVLEQLSRRRPASK